MVFNKVVARFKDGTVMKGKTNDFLPSKPIFHLELTGGEVVDVKINDLKTVKVNIQDLKAAFFVKDLEGDKEYKETYSDAIAGGGRKVRVKFFDGEEIIGYSHSYSPGRQGFFIIPADTKSNNDRVFVINSATKKIEFL